MQLLIGAMAIGLAPIFVKFLTQDSGVSPIGAGFWRMAIGCAGFYVLNLFGSKKSQVISGKFLDQRSILVLCLSGILFALDLSAWHTSFIYTSIASSTLIANLSSVFVPVCGIVFFREPLKRGIAGGGLIAIAGVIGLTLSRNNAARVHQEHSIVMGEGLAFLTAFFYTGYMLCIKSVTRKVHPGVAMMWSSFVSAVFLLGFCLVLGEGLFPKNESGWIWLCGVGLVSQVAGQGLIARAIAILPVSRSALMLLSAPASSAIFGWVFLGEFLTVQQILSILITLAGIAIVALSAQRDRRTQS
jgi:drug/metabolite transporter (DMT)-like permease